MTRWLVVTLLAAAAFAVAACGDGEGAAARPGPDPAGATVRIALMRANTPIELAHEDRSLASRLGRLGAKVEWAGPFPAFGPAVEALNANAIDITIGSITSAVGALAGQSNFTIFARQDAASTDEAIVVKRDSGIESVADLKGKRVAVNRGGTGEYLLLKALDDSGLSDADVEPVYLAPPDAAPVFASGEVDAWATWSAFTALAQVKYGAKVLVTGPEVGSHNDVVYVVRNQFLDEHPDLVTAVFDGLLARTKEAAADAQATAAITADLQELPLDVAEQMLELAQAPLEPVDAPMARRFQSVADYFAARQVIPEAVSLEGKTVDVTGLAG